MTDQVLSNDTRWQKVLFSSSATIRQLLEVVLKGNKDTKEIKERNRGGKGRRYERNHLSLNFKVYFPKVLLNILR
jgi:hypothetical protein